LGNPMVETRGLTKTFVLETRHRLISRILGKKAGPGTRVAALRDIDLSINPQEVFGLVGPNGAGKTTLIRILSGFVLPEAGTATVNGFDVYSQPYDVLRSVSLIIPRSGFHRWVSVEQNLLYYAKMYGSSRKEAERRVAEAVRIVGLEEKRKVGYGFLSSGMKQRMNIAKGLLRDAPIFLMDEPTVGLDVSSTRKFHETVRQLAKEGRTILYTSHNMQEVQRICGRVAVLHKGRILVCDQPSNLVERLKMPSAIQVKVKQASPDLVRRIRDAEFTERVLIEGEDRPIGLYQLRILTRAVGPTIREIASLCLEGGATLVEWHVREPTLQDAFLQMIGSEAQSGDGG